MLRDDLIAARKRLADPSRWMKSRYASYTAEGEAICFCLMGAIGHSTIGRGSDAIEAHDAIIAVLRRRGFHEPISSFNDAPDTTHSDILAVIDAAIANTEAA